MAQQKDTPLPDLFQAHPVPMWIYDLHTLRFLAVNDAAIAQYGYSEAEFLAMTIENIRPEKELLKLHENLDNAAGGELEKSGPWQHRKKDGTLIDVEISSHTLTFGGRPCKFVLAQDVTTRVHAEIKIIRLSRIYAVLSGINSAIVRIRDQQELFEEACRIAAMEGAFVTAYIAAIDPDALGCRIVAWAGKAPALEEQSGFTVQAGAFQSDWPPSRAVRERRPVVCNDIQTDASLVSLGTDFARQGKHAVAAFPLFVDQRVVAVLVLFAAAADYFDDAEFKLLSELAGDLSFALQYFKQEERLQHLAYFDSLTGLPNRSLFHDRLANFVAQVKHENAMMCVVLMDLERFKQLNDVFGRHTGDRLLQMVAQRLSGAPEVGCGLARIGADMFGFATRLTDLDAVEVLDTHVFGPLAAPFKIDERDFRIGARVGVAVYPVDGEDAETLFRHAESALKHAKSTGERYAYYTSEINARITHKLELEEHLREALAQGQFVLHYQPRVDLRSGQIVAAEALIRWKHPHNGLVLPAEFIPLAEETGLIVPIGKWVIDSVCAQQAAWLARDVSAVPIAVNLSAVQLMKSPLQEVLSEALARHRLAPNYLELELTESVVMASPDEAAATLRALRKLGLRLSLDDFGTGYSSLAYLKRFPFNFVKIDRAFITDITRNPEDAAIATAIIAMAHSLNLRVVAEGVATEGQLAYLLARGCDEIQGFYFSHAVEADEFEALLHADRHLALPTSAPDAQRTLLLVDYEPKMLAALRRVVRHDAYRVLTASSGEEALELLALNPVQVIVCDQRMPVMSGAEFFNVVKQLYPDTMRIILSSFVDLEAITDSVNRGAVYKFLTKPWDDELLRGHIRDAFRHYRAHASID